MSRDQHEHKINELQNRHHAVLEKFTKLEAVNLPWWKSPWITTPVQLELLAALVEQLETTHLVAQAAARNLNSALKVVIDANTRNQ